MNTESSPIKLDFGRRFQSHLKHLKLKGLQPKAIDKYARGIRRMGDYIDYQIDNLSPAQLNKRDQRPFSKSANLPCPGIASAAPSSSLGRPRGLASRLSPSIRSIFA